MVACRDNIPESKKREKVLIAKTHNGLGSKMKTMRKNLYLMHDNDETNNIRISIQDYKLSPLLMFYHWILFSMHYTHHMEVYHNMISKALYADNMSLTGYVPRRYFHRNFKVALILTLNLI